MSDPVSTSDEKLFEVLARCIDESSSGVTSLESLVSAHPEFADELRDYFKMRQGVDDITGPFRAGSVDLQQAETSDTNSFQNAADTKRFDETRLPQFTNYECVRLIDGGGMGVVYEARDVRLARVVALKMIRSHATASAEDVGRFQREAQRVAQLNHPSIVPIYEVGEETAGDQARHFFTMRLMNGGSLADLLKQGSLHRDLAVRFLSEVARGLHYAHQHGIIHRDVKPGNILFDEDGNAYIADFGLAKRVDAAEAPVASATGILPEGSSAASRPAIVGTPMYMAPEQISRKGELTTAADVYGLGVVMYEMLTGKPPFQATNAYQTLIEVVRSEPKPLRKTDPAIHRDLEAICLKCLAKEPLERYGSAEALADDLDRWQRNESILARRSLPWERVAKWVRRSPALAIVSAVALLAIGFSIVSLWQSKEAIRQEKVQTEDALDAQTVTLEELRTTREREQRMAYLQAIALAERESSKGKADGVLAEAPEHLRGWEWKYIQHRDHTFERSTNLPFEASSIVRHPSEESCYIGGGSAGFAGDLLRVEGNLSIAPFDSTHDDEVTCVAISTDGRRMVSGDRAGQVHVRNLEDQSERTRVVQVPSPIRDVACLSTGQIATATADGVVRFWEENQGSVFVESGSLVGHEGDIWSIAFGPQNGTLVSAGSDATVRLWDVSTGKAGHVLLGHSELVRHVSFSSDGKQVLSSSHDGTARIWRADTGNEVLRLRHPAFVTQALFAPSGHIVTSCVDGILRVWDARTGTLKTSLRGHSGSIWSFCLSADGEEIVSISEDGTVKQWRWSDTFQLVVPDAVNDWFSAVAMDELGKLVVGVSDNRRLMVWRDGLPIAIDEIRVNDHTQVDVSAGLRIVCGDSASVLGPDDKWQAAEKLVKNSAQCVSIDSTGERVATSDGYSISLWDRKSTSLVRRWSLAKNTTTLELSHDGQQLAAITRVDRNSAISHATASRTVHLWNCETGDELHSFDTTGDRLRFSPSGKLLTVLNNNEQVDVRDTSTGKTAFSIRCERAPITAIAFSRDESRVFVGHEDGFVTLWDTVTQRRILTLGELDGRVTDLALRNDGTLVGLSILGAVRQWAVSAGM